MKPISKIKITGLAFVIVAFLATNLMAVPQSKQYPEYPQSNPAPAIEATNAAPAKAYTEAPAAAAPTRPAATKTTTTTTTTRTTVTETKPATVVTTKTESKPAYVAPVGTGAIGNRFDSNLYTIEKTLLSAPGEVGSAYQYRVRVTALADITEVRVTEHLPEGATYVGATPDVAKSGNDLNWGYASMRKGEQQDTVITVRPNMEGEFLTATKVCVDPVARLGFRAGSPRLAIEKIGPREAELNSTIGYTVRVSNVGTATAKDVVVVDNLPSGLRGSEAQPTYTIGTIAAGETKTVSIPVTAASQGQWVNKATATASNAASVSAESPVTIVMSRIGVTKTGPERQTITRNATYTITVTNEGSSTLDNITVTDDIPKGSKLVSASDAPVTQNNNQVVWTIASLAPAQSVTRNVTITAAEPMTTTNKVTARTGKGLTATAAATTIWDGPPGVLTEIIDNVDPIRVGDSVTYTIRITNQGAYREVNSQIRVIFSDEITPVACSDKTATITGKVVTLPDMLLKPRGVITFTIQAKGAQEGVATTRLEFNSSFLPKPINKDETTYVY
ncbi:putative repeat protein (TIGR01451 family) [Ereboglobus sp. PH5-5]|uniref:DUF11 domain-containing protein n=1 Tax=unclassified Ereboglobus TaxID=2626932 RepID=UPI002406D0CB|nr:MULTISPECIES: DUF11 domain-containing protein [unclassified Ereboglobus]MDF9828144.1 putative repeat protein (TIGR01451 family) [Ereboglobus sp. PH5-10]MDF9832894.1 putative repeat protein (TIGR01451 family) [Ereboglobus sp. PH5-5]